MLRGRLKKRRGRSGSLFAAAANVVRRAVCCLGCISALGKGGVAARRKRTGRGVNNDDDYDEYDEDWIDPADLLVENELRRNQRRAKTITRWKERRGSAHLSATPASRHRV
jgi:hypothetical protein